MTDRASVKCSFMTLRDKYNHDPEYPVGGVTGAPSWRQTWGSSLFGDYLVAGLSQLGLIGPSLKQTWNGSGAF